MRRQDEKAPENVADELLQTLNESIQARTKIAQDLVNAERDREQELQALHGDIQGIGLGLGELVGRIDEINQRLIEIDKRLGNLGKELRDDMRKSRHIGLQMSVILEKSLRGWTESVQSAEAQGVSVPKPPGYDLTEESK